MAKINTGKRVAPDKPLKNVVQAKKRAVREVPNKQSDNKPPIYKMPKQRS
jgi:hypothetical protein